MSTYSIFIEDDRYSAPTLHFVVDASEARAFDFAVKYLLDSPHHQSVRVDCNGAEVFVRHREDISGSGADPAQA